MVTFLLLIPALCSTFQNCSEPTQLPYVVCLPQKTERRKDPDFKPSTVARQQRADKGPVEPAEEGRAIRELRNLCRILQAIQVQVEQKLGNTQSAEEWMQVGFITDRLLFGLYVIFITVSFFTIVIVWVNAYNN